VKLTARLWIASAAAPVVACALFPSLSELGPGVGNDGGPDAASDVVVPDGCPPNADPSLLVYYPFDDGTGNVVRDCSGNGNDGVLSSTAANAWVASGHTNGAIAFDPTATTCIFGPGGVEVHGDFTVSVWFQPTSTTQASYLIGHRSSNTSREWRLSREPSSTQSGYDIELQIATLPDAGCGGGECSAASAAVADGAWHHAAGVFVQGVSEWVYVDGQAFPAPLAAPSILTDSTAVFTVGCRSDHANYFSGVLDEIRVYTRALSDAEIKALASK
jgi:hypothetical protein